MGVDQTKSTPNETEFLNSNIEQKDSVLFELEIIEPQYMSAHIQNSIKKYFKTQHYTIQNDKNKIAPLLQNKVSATLSSLHIDATHVEKLQVSSQGILKVIIENEEKDILSFDLNQNLEELQSTPQKDIYIGNTQKLQQEKESDRITFTQNIGHISRILNGMDYIFERNEKEWFDELNEHDRLNTDKFGDDITGLNIVQIQEVFKKYFNKVNSIPKEHLSKEMIIELTKQETKYFKMVMGVGDTYEGGASLLKERQHTFDTIIDNMITFSGSNHELLKKLSSLHKEIDLNDYQSTTVEKSYGRIKTTLHRKVLKTLVNAKDDTSKDKNLILFAQIITGRGHDIDDNLRDPSLAEQALVTVMQRKNGVIDQLNKDGNSHIDDPEIKNKNPKSIIDTVRTRFYKRYGTEDKMQMLFNKNLMTAGYEDVLNISEEKQYSDLTFFQKTKLSVLHRVAQKMEDGKTILEIAKESSGKALSLENPMVAQHYIKDDFVGLFNSVAIDYIEEVADKLDDTFTKFWGVDGLTSADMNLKQGSIQAEAFDVFQDIRGAGLFDRSDDFWQGIKTAGKFGAAITVGMGAVILLSPVIGFAAAGAAAGAAASVTSMAINPHGYDTKKEAALDISTDIATGVITGYAGGAIAQGFEKQGAKFLSKQALRNPKFIMAADLTFLGLVPEASRMKWINGKYHNQEILEKDKTSEEGDTKQQILEQIKQDKLRLKQVSFLILELLKNEENKSFFSKKKFTYVDSNLLTKLKNDLGLTTEDVEEYRGGTLESLQKIQSSLSHNIQNKG